MCFSIPAFAPLVLPRPSEKAQLFLKNQYVVRSSELHFARWDEFDFDKSLWRVPAKREEIKSVRYSYRGMKMKEEHTRTVRWDISFRENTRGSGHR